MFYCFVMQLQICVQSFQNNYLECDNFIVCLYSGDVLICKKNIAIGANEVFCFLLLYNTVSIETFGVTGNKLLSRQ